MPRIQKTVLARTGRVFGSENVGIPWKSYSEHFQSHASFFSKLRYRFFAVFKFLDHPEALLPDYRNTSDYLFLPDSYSAKNHLQVATVSGGIALMALVAATIWGINWLWGITYLSIVSGAIALFYFSFMTFKLYVVLKSARAPFITFDKDVVAATSDTELPVYTVLIPLYREEKVIEQIKRAMTALDYPADKLDIIITLEEYDQPTIDAIDAAHFPSHFRTLILPNVAPKTKPKALNVALLEARGEFVVIYDAEIIPDQDQLKKAVHTFRARPDLDCLQVRLDHYNSEQNILTGLFNAEFSFYYDLFLPGLQQLGFPIPLSGHSTHFRTQFLENVGGWDPYNVTEDCDLGMRLYRCGYKTGIIDSVSREEATSSVSSWIRQRTRWMKGFIQTSVVHLRHPFHFKGELGSWKNFLVFLFIVPGTVAINILNFFSWILFSVWFVTHATIIQSLFAAPILYISVFSFVVGNFMFTYLNLLSEYRRHNFALVKYSVLSPCYWVLLAYATLRAGVHMITQPHQWEKTTHGLHLKT